MFRVFVWLGGEKLVGKVIYRNIREPNLFIIQLEQKPMFPSYRYFKIGDFVIARNNRGQFVVLRKMDKPISEVSNEWRIV